MTAENQPQSQQAADQDAAARREADLKAAADDRAAAREAQDKEIAERRTAEDEKLADARLEEDRVGASARNRLVVAAAAVQTATNAISAGGDPALLRDANGELQAAVANHLDTVPEQPCAPRSAPEQPGPAQTAENE